MKKVLLLSMIAILCVLSVITFAQDAVSGASQVVKEEGQLSQEQIKELVLTYLRGFPMKRTDDKVELWSYREMYQIATVHGDMPGLSSVEFVLDPETMCLYASSEKDTEKVRDIANNPNVVMYWYHQIPENEYVPQKNDYFNSYGVQIRGKARLMNPSDENFEKIASMYLKTLFGLEIWEKMDAEKQAGTIKRLAESNAWIEIKPDEYAVTSLFWVFNKENSRRPQFYDPNSPYFGKTPRQVYFVKNEK